MSKNIDKFNFSSQKGHDLDIQTILENRKFDLEHCFLCAGSLQAKGETSEHVIPRWAQNRYDLWYQRLTLLNKTNIQYRYLTVPCCDDCNTYQLAPIETLISNAVGIGASAVRNLSLKVIYLWISKIFFGLLYKELFLVNNRASVNEEFIIHPEIIQKFYNLMFFLQEARGKVETIDFCPGSIIVVNTQKPRTIQHQWDLCDNIDYQMIAIRMGSVGIIASLGDGGAQNSLENMGYLSDFPFSPLQFRELCAIVSYRASLSTRTPKYLSFSEHGNDVIKSYQLPLGGYSFLPLFEKWNYDVFAYFLSHYTGFSIEEIRPNPNQIRSYIYKPSGELNYSPIDNED